MKHSKSKERIKDIGEVFTPPKIANDMIDMLDQEKFRDCKFFEPTCGNGNILIEGTKRRLDMLCEKYKQELPSKSSSRQAEYAALECVVSTFGADIMLDNVIETRDRMKSLVSQWLIQKCFQDRDMPMMPSLFVKIFEEIDRNIQHADCLAGLCNTFEEAKIAASKTKVSREFFEKNGWVKIWLGEEEKALKAVV